MVIPINAEGDKISFVTPEFNLIINTSYDSSKYTLVETNNQGTVKFVILDELGNEQEAWVFEPNAIQRGVGPQASITTYRHTHYVALGFKASNFIHEVTLELYNDSGFSQINRLKYRDGWVDGWSYFRRESYEADVYPSYPTRGVWPTLAVEVSYSAVVGAQLDLSMNVEFGSQLIRAGFTVGSSYYYSKRIYADYTIRVY